MNLCDMKRETYIVKSLFWWNQYFFTDVDRFNTILFQNTIANALRLMYFRLSTDNSNLFLQMESAGNFFFSIL